MGYLTCVDFDGTIYDTTKYCALQAQQVGFCSHLVCDYFIKLRIKIDRLIFRQKKQMTSLSELYG